MPPPFIGLLGKQKYWITLVTNLYIISTLKYLNFGRMFTKVVKSKPDIVPLNVFGSILRKEGVRERNMKLLLETVTYIAIKESVTCITTIETVMCIMHCKNTTCIITREAPICIITVIITTHIFAAETVTCLCVVEIFNIVATDTVTCIIVTEKSANIHVTESTTSKPE